MKVLRVLDSGDNLPLGKIRSKVYPLLNLTPKEIESAFDDEFKYRLEFLRLNGVVRNTPLTDEYGITLLGKAFLKEARGRKDYENVNV